MKHLKWLLSMFLCFMILLVGCVDEPAETTDIGNKQTDEISTNQTEANETKPPEPDEFVFAYGDDEELAMAYEKGFVPKALWGKMGENISLSDFVNMVRAIAAEENAAVLAEFDGYMGEAGNIAAPADRSLASIVLYYATYLLEVPERTWFSLLEDGSCWSTHGADLNDYMGERWDEFKHLYAENEAYSGAFPRIYEGGYAWWDMFWEGDASVAAYFSMLNRSTFEGRMYFDFDFENKTFHMDNMVSVEEAIRAATRFYVMCNHEEVFLDSMREHNAASPHKKPIEDYDINALADSITIGIHFNHAQTDWLDSEGEYYLEGDRFWQKMTEKWEVLTGRDNAKAVLKAYKEKGFDTVQLAVTFTPYFNTETDKLDEEFLDYIEYWTNLILDEGMKCIIGSQRTYAAGNTAFVDGEPTDIWMEPEYKEAVNAEFGAMWSQIAKRFRDYDERVMFKPFIEPQQAIFPDIETGDYEYQASRINELNQICVDVVRAVGGNSEKRPLILGPMWGQFFMEAMVPPKDDYVIAYYHTYFSGTGAIGFYDLSADQVVANENGDILRWSQEDKVLMEWVDRTYEQIRVFKEKYKIPLIIGEFATSALLSEEDKIFMTSYVVSKANELDCPVIYWDGYFGGDGDTGFYHLGRDEWRTEALIDEMMRLAEARKK